MKNLFIALSTGFLLCFHNADAKSSKQETKHPLAFKEYPFGFTYSNKKIIWAKDLCKSLDYNLLRPAQCKLASDNIGNKSIRCTLSEKKLELAAYKSLENCKVDLQMMSEGESE